MSIKNEIKLIIKNSLTKANIEEENIVVDIPKDKKNGDYASNIAMVLTKKMHKSPMDIAEIIIKNIDKEIFESITIANPGFINFKLKKSYLLAKINDILIANKEYGKNNTGRSQKINLEFVSANPTGDLHVGHARGATYGDNLARILSFCGYDVTKEYYVNDAGNQMNNLGISIKERYKEACGKTFAIPEGGYHGKEIIAIAEEIREFYGDSKLTMPTQYFKEYGLTILLQKIKDVLDMYRVNFDVFTSEQSLYDNSSVENTLDKLRKTGKCYVAEDALWLKTTDYKDEKDRVLIKNDGNYTYFLPDIAYHSYKYSRNFDMMIDVLGSDHHGYINRLRSAMDILGYDSNKLEIEILQMVRLIKDGEEVKISKRTGKTITLNDLIADIGVNATRYFFSSKSLDTQMEFNLDLAGSESNENPVYYIEYANARISSIVDSYKEEISKIDKYTTLDNENTYTILNKLYEFEDVVVLAATHRHPHLIANYAYELATLFHSYYGKERIINNDDDVYTKERIVLLRAIKVVLNNALNLLGIIPREHM